jgi:hypothetical protein
VAIRESKSKAIDFTRRPIRCERARVNRTIVICKRGNGNIIYGEGARVLGGFGPLESVQFAGATSTVPTLGLMEGNKCFGRFQYRQDAVDCYNV